MTPPPPPSGCQDKFFDFFFSCTDGSLFPPVRGFPLFGRRLFFLVGEGCFFFRTLGPLRLIAVAFLSGTGSAFFAVVLFFFSHFPPFRSCSAPFFFGGTGGSFGPLWLFFFFFLEALPAICVASFPRDGTRFFPDNRFSSTFALPGLFLSNFLGLLPPGLC